MSHPRPWAFRPPGAARLKDAVMDEWFRPLWTSPEIRATCGKCVLGVPPEQELLRWTEKLRDFGRPALVVRAAEDKAMPL
ncbi:hypothetical protein [Streptomyces sp. NPDC058620]|uniref:hypothetical protein n=1 Tax=Streptomyces sp. NPDC058620 TaxID=3346560 RepID=UPI003651AAD7